MSPVKLIVLYHKSRKKSTKTGIGFLGRVYSCDEIGRIVGNWRYTLVMSPTKTAGNRAKKNTPWDYHGMSNIPGGARNLLPLAYERPSPDNTNEMGGDFSFTSSVKAFQIILLVMAIKSFIKFTFMIISLVYYLNKEPIKC